MKQGRAGEPGCWDMRGMASGLEVCLQEWRETEETNTLNTSFLLQRLLITDLFLIHIIAEAKKKRRKKYIFQCSPILPVLIFHFVLEAHSSHINACQKPRGTSLFTNFLVGFSLMKFWKDGWVWRIESEALLKSTRRKLAHSWRLNIEMGIINTQSITFF